MFEFKTNPSDDKVTSQPFVSWTVSKPTQAVVQVLQDRFLARDQTDTLWENGLAPKIIFRSEGHDGGSKERVLCPNRFAWGNKQPGGIRVSLKPGMKYSLTLQEQTAGFPIVWWILLIITLASICVLVWYFSKKCRKDDHVEAP